MREKKRIDRILAKIRIVWKTNPDLRLMQLLGNCFDAGDHFYKEDDELERRLKGVYDV